MAPAKTAARSRRTHSYSWSSDSSAIRPVYQWPDLESTSSGRTSGDDLSDAGDHEHRTSPNDSNTLHENDLSSIGESIDNRSSRPFDASHLGKKMNYDSDSCLTPRSRRTLRRTLSGVTEPWPSVKTPAKPALDTIYSPTHEILHPMQSLLLEKSLSNTVEKSLGNSVAVRSTKVIPTRRTMSVDFDSRRDFDTAKAKPNQFKFESYAFPEPQLREEDESVGELKESENTPEGPAPNIVVIIVDAEKKLTKFTALDWAINVFVQPGDEIIVLGVLKHVSSPMGYKVVANTDPLVGVNKEILQSEVKKTTEIFEQKLSDSGRRAECGKKNVKLTVRIAPGSRARTVVVRELTALKATYAVFDRKLTRGTRYYGKHLSCHAVRMRSNGRSTKTIFTMTTSPQKMPTATITSTASSSPTSDTSSSASPAPSPTHFWRRFTPFRSSRNSRTTKVSSPRSSTASSENASPSAAATVDSLNLESFMSEMQDFSISLDRSKIYDGLGKESGSKLALQSCVVADAYAYKKGMDSHRLKHRPISVTIPPICAT